MWPNVSILVDWIVEGDGNSPADLHTLCSTGQCRFEVQTFVCSLVGKYSSVCMDPRLIKHILSADVPVKCTGSTSPVVEHFCTIPDKGDQEVFSFEREFVNMFIPFQVRCYHHTKVLVATHLFNNVSL